MDDAAIARVVESFAPGAVVLGAIPLAGGISATMIRVDVLTDEGTQSVVLRQPWAGHPDPSDAIATEARVLGHLANAEIPVPHVLHVLPDDPAGAVVVLEYVAGAAVYATDDPDGYAVAFADQLARIHAVTPPDGVPLRVERIAHGLFTDRRPPDRSIREDEILAALRPRWPFPTRNPDAFLHGDFWMGNVLWSGGSIRAVVDWEEACIGDPVADLASTRLDFLWVFGRTAMDAFTKRYLAVTDADATDLALWDLVAAQRPAGNLDEWASWWPDMGRPDIDVETIRADLSAFVDAAVERLG